MSAPQNIRSVALMTPDEQKVVDRLLKEPRIEPLLGRLAETMTKELPQIVQILSNMKPGDVWEETGQSRVVQQQILTGKTEDVPRRRFKLLAPALPHKAPIIARMVADLCGAKQEFETPTDTAMMIYHDDDRGDDNAMVAFYTINMRDFCKMFALGEWKLISTVTMLNKDAIEDQFEQKGVIDPVSGIDDEVKKIIKP